MIPYKRLKQIRLFSGMKEQEIEAVLNCLSVQIKDYEKGCTIFHSGDPISEVGVVLKGSVHIIKEDYWGNRDLIAWVEENDVFGETYACIPSAVIPIDVIAAEKVEVLFLKVKRVITTCSASCKFHNQLIQNMLIVLAEKNLQITNKVDIVTKRTTRSKLMTYLSKLAGQMQNSTFIVPLNRQQLADYLGVDRSAMTVELHKLQKEGLIRFKKNQFELLMHETKK